MLPSQLEEGLCQLIAHKYLEYYTRDQVLTLPDSDGSSSSASVEPTESSQDRWNRLLLGMFRKQIESDPSEVYGDGFRKVRQCCEQLSLHIVLDHIKQGHVDLPHC